MVMTPLSLKDQIENALRQHIADVREEVIQEAQKEFERRVRESIARAAINLASMYSIESIGTVLHVRIQTGEANGTSR